KTQAGIVPTSFSLNGQVFVVRHSIPVGSPWTVEGTISKVVVDDGVTVTIADDRINATIDVNGTGILNITGTELPKLGALSPSSKVRYTSTHVQKASYGHLELL